MHTMAKAPLSSNQKTLELCLNLYRYIWSQSGHRQLMIIALTMVLSPLMMVPLELQRRIVNEALPERDVATLLALGAIYLAVILIQGIIKFLLNMVKGHAVESVARDIRLRVMLELGRISPQDWSIGSDQRAGTVVSMLAAEAEDVSGFSGEALGSPLLTGGTIIFVMGYLLWVQPAISALAIVLYMPQALIVPLTQYSINRLARLRIVSVRSLGRLASSPSTGRGPDSIVQRIYKLRIAIYLRKYGLAALGNFLDSLGTIIVLTIGGYLVLEGTTQAGTLLVFISGLNKIADPWDELINFYRTVSNTAVAYEMIRSQIEHDP